MTDPLAQARELLKQAYACRDDARSLEASAAELNLAAFYALPVGARLKWNASGYELHVTKTADGWNDMENTAADAWVLDQWERRNWDIEGMTA